LRISGVAVRESVGERVTVSERVIDAVRVCDGERVTDAVRVLVGVGVSDGVTGVAVLLGVNVSDGVSVILGVNVSDGVSVILGVNVILGVVVTVMVGATANASVTAFPALMIPVPHFPTVVHAFAALSAGKVVTLASFVIYAVTVSTAVAADRLGNSPYKSAATPATCGVAILVPCILPYPAESSGFVAGIVYGLVYHVDSTRPAERYPP
jgi:hypothetical protein